MNTSDTIGKLAEALAKAQGDMPPIPKNGINPFLKNQYILLDDIVAVALKILPKHGLAIIQMPVSAEGQVGVTTRLAHASGEWVESTVYLSLNDEKGKSAAQVAGSVITYLRRYSLGALLGVASESDDDGNGGTKKAAPVEKPAPKPSKNGTPANKRPHAKKPAVVKWIVSEGLAKNGPNAAAVFDALNTGGALDALLDNDDGDAVRAAIKLYREWRDTTDADPQIAATQALAGNAPS